MKKLSLSLTFLAVLVFSIMATPQTPFVEAQDFSVTISPSSQTHHPGAYASYYIEVRSLSGFSSTVTLSFVSIYPAPSGTFNFTIEPPSVKPPVGQSAHAVLTIGIPAGTGVGYTGYFTITVRGLGAGLSHDATATLIVQDTSPDFCVKTVTKWVKISPSVSTSYTLNFIGIGGFSETVTVSVNVPPAYATATLTPTYTVSTWPTTTLVLSISTTAQVQPGSYPIEIYSSGTTRFHSDYVILVIQANGDFSISASPTSLSINQGDTASSDIKVTSTSPFASPTSLTWSWVDTAPTTGVTPSLSPTTLTPTSGGSKTSKLTITTTATATKGTFTIMVTGTCYHLSDNVNITLTITSAADFTITASPTSLSIVAAQTGTSTVTVASTAGFSSAVSLSFSWVGASPTGVTPSLSAYSVTPPAGSTATSTLTIATSSTTALGTYVVRITGVSGVLIHTADVTFTVTTPPPIPDFTMTVTPSSAQITRGQQGNFIVLATSTGGFASPISLTLSGQPSDVAGSFDPTSVTPPSGGSGTSTLTVRVGSAATPGTHTLTITGTSGAISHQATIVLTVETLGPGPLCIIATATYGSELAPEVQFLRSFRDQQVKSTFAGDQFMATFNAWYYSFSPYIAQFIASNTFARAVMKVLLYPLIGILHLAAMTFNAFSFSHELAIVMAGLVASALIGVVYFSPLAILALVLLRKYRKTTLKMSQLRMLGIVWVASLVMIFVGEVAPLPALMMASTALFVLSTLSLGAITAATALLRRIR